MRLAIAMTTAQRLEHYAVESLESLRQAGFAEELHVFAEPGSHDLSGPDTCIHQNSERLGCYRNWRSALDWMLANISADWFLMVQDDVVYRSDTHALLVEAMESGKHQKVGFLSPYTSVGMVSPAMKPKLGWHPAAHGVGKGFWGALTFCMPAASARALATNKRFMTHNHHRKLDCLVGNVFMDLNRSRLVHLPSLCDHIGKVSTLGRHKVKGIAYGRRGFRFSAT